MGTRRLAAFCLVLAVAVAGSPVAAGWLRSALPGAEADLLSVQTPRRGAAYYRTLAALAELWGVADAGGWPAVGGGPLLRDGMIDPRVPSLRRRLSLPVPAGIDSLRYDAEVVAAVRSFQVRHGLAPDGAVGRLTVAALDVPAAVRADQLALNLQRVNGLPPDRGPRYVLVNVPAGTLAMVADDSLHGVMRAVVGRPDRPTPTIASRITQLELNPAWNIPQRLARQDVLPHLRKNPDYWREHGIRVFATWLDGAPELDPAAIDWPAIRPANLAFKLRQEPGPLNPLGRMKFVFENPYSVYIHDTPSRERFNSPARFYSSGCVRIEDPVALAEFLLQGAGPRLRAQFDAAREGTDPRRVRLPEPVPVFMVYWTAWVDPDGVVQFRDDIYGHDAALVASSTISPPPAWSPAADRAGVEVDEVGLRVVADASPLLP